jgi:hypothetical protein
MPYREITRSRGQGGSIFLFLSSDPQVGTLNIAAWSFASVAAITAVALFLVRRTSQPLFTSEMAPGLMIGLSIYTGLYAFLGSNFNYKLVFPVLAIPQILQWIRRQNGYRNFAFTFLTVMTLALWLSAQTVYWMLLLKEVMNWCLFGMSTFVLLHFLFASVGSKRSPECDR